MTTTTVLPDLTLALLLAAAPGPVSPIARAAPACVCPCATPAALGPGSRAPLVRPSPAAYALNRAGRELYRQRRWEEARAQYRAALAADPGFLGPRLNLATAFTQEERFAEAVSEAESLVDLAYVPWGREVSEAADLAPLRARPEWARLTSAVARAAAAWGEALAGHLLFVARTAPPVRLPEQGVLHLGLSQEVFAWSPTSGRYRQVTSDDGRVLGFVPSPDGRRLAYLRAGKLVRAAGAPTQLRGVSIRMLDLPTMSVSPPLVIEGDVSTLTLLWPHGQTDPLLHAVTGDGTRTLRFDGRTLAPAPGAGDLAAQARAIPERALVVDGAGARAPGPMHTGGSEGCAFKASDQLRKGKPPAVSIAPARGGRRRSFTLASPDGAGLRGLPFP